MTGKAMTNAESAIQAGVDPLPIEKAEQLRAALKADNTAYLKAVDEFVRTVRHIAEENGVTVSGIVGLALSVDGVTVTNSRSWTGNLPV